MSLMGWTLRFQKPKLGSVTLTLLAACRSGILAEAVIFISINNQKRK